MVGTVLVALSVLSAGVSGCGDSASSTAPVDGTDKAAQLLGDWYTQGEDPDLGGSVQVRMELQAAGQLRVSVTPAGGATLSFPGTWALADDRLQLRGVWFQPDGEVEVRCEIHDQQLTLTAADGSTQTWQRQPLAHTGAGVRTVQTTRTELSPPYGLGALCWQAGSGRHSPSTTKRYS